MTDDGEAHRAAAFAFEVGTLRHVARSGWGHAGVRHAESVAEHSHRTSLLAAVLASMEGADPARACLLAALHDTQESRTGDVSHVGRRYVSTAPNATVTADQVGRMPAPAVAVITAAVDEYEAQETPEAIVAKDADKLDCLIAAVEYLRAGHVNAQEWIDTSRSALKTVAAQHIADAAIEMTGLEWRTSS